MPKKTPVADGISVTGTGAAAPLQDAEALGTVEVEPAAQAAVRGVASGAPLTSPGALAETGVMTAGEPVAANTGEVTATADPVKGAMTPVEDALLTNSRSDPYPGSPSWSNPKPRRRKPWPG